MPTVELPQGRVHFRDEGEGPVVVLVHGVLVNGLLWRKVVPELTGGARVVVPELPLGAHPEPLHADADLSPTGLAQLVADLLDALDLDDVTLVGNDTGGAICQIVAANHPARVGRLVLTSCDMEENFPPKAFAPLIRLAQLPGVLPAIGQLMRFGVVRRSPAAFGWLAKHGIPDEVVDAWLAPGRDARIRRDLRKVLAGAGPAHTIRAAEALRRSFTGPILLPWADDDRSCRSTSHGASPRACRTPAWS
jgi:pimeloyl-ACP methyl ester carboxylesterase